MSKEIFKDSFTEQGELYDSPEYGLIIKFPFAQAIKRVVRHMIGKELEVNFKVYKYIRSNSQNRYLWGCVYPTIIAWHLETTGERLDKDAVHAFILQEILQYKLVSKVVQGKEVIYMDGKSTRNLSTGEFNQLKKDIQAYYAPLGCIIPDPRGNNYLSDYAKRKLKDE